MIQLFDRGEKTRLNKYPTYYADRSDQEWYRSGLGNMVRMYGDDLPKEFERLVRSNAGPSGDVRQRTGPFIYGFTYTFNPAQSEPIFQEFGNVRPSYRGLRWNDGRMPLMEMIDKGDFYSIKVELPGVSKENIRLDVDEEAFEISTDGDPKFQSRSFFAMPVNPNTAKANYQNGVLNITVEKREDVKPRETTTSVNIE
ncbi:MAG TPA: Hsp20/alpha crystallin family protein [Methanotrichaceae archaeon]|nr:Hsp20/alpha crystallin family protein [Methanotrichaceae archaeon]